VSKCNLLCRGVVLQFHCVQQHGDKRHTQCSTLTCGWKHTGVHLVFHCVLPCECECCDYVFWVNVPMALSLGQFWHIATLSRLLNQSCGVFLILMPESGFNSAPCCSGELSMLYDAEMGARFLAVSSPHARVIQKRYYELKSVSARSLKCC